jgi:hypothetical protein
MLERLVAKLLVTVNAIETSRNKVLNNQSERMCQ